MNKRIAWVLCRWQHYIELWAFLPLVVATKIGLYNKELYNDRVWRTDMQTRQKIMWSSFAGHTVLCIMFPFSWLTQGIVLFVTGPGSAIFERISFPRLPEVYCPTAHPEKYGEKKEKIEVKK